MSDKFLMYLKEKCQTTESGKSSNRHDKSKKQLLKEPSRSLTLRHSGLHDNSLSKRRCLRSFTHVSNLRIYGAGCLSTPVKNQCAALAGLGTELSHLAFLSEHWFVVCDTTTQPALMVLDVSNKHLSRCRNRTRQSLYTFSWNGGRAVLPMSVTQHSMER